MTQKKKLYSLLAILLSVTLLVTGIICALIFWLAQQSTQNFENFIVESRQQEIDSAVHSFSTDVDTLLLLMQTELNDSALTRLQLYYDSRIFNYDYLSQTTAVRNQISIIENSMPFTETLEICMLDSMRKVAWGSIATLDDDTMEMISEALGSGTRGMTLENGKIRLLLSKAALDSETPHNAVAIASLSSMNLFSYLKRYLPDNENSRVAVFVVQDETEIPLTMSSSLSTTDGRKIAEAIQGSASGFLRCELQGKQWLLNWQQTAAVPVKVCQLTPVSLITDQMREYRLMITMVCAVSIVVMLSLACFLQQMVHKPVSKIDAAMRKVGKGDLSVRLTGAKSNEFQQIYDQFNQMTVRLQELIDREYTLKLLNAKSELKQLRYQIRPHFLYNTYFNLRALLMNEEYDVAEEMMDVLGRYLRYITTSARDEATLREEMEHAKAYVEIQKMRFGNHLEARLAECPSAYAEKLVPRIIIQPLLENTFEHGIKDMQEKGVISVQFEAEGERLSIYVDDNGPNATDELIERARTILAAEEYNPSGDSVALSNIHRRIRMLYQPGSGLYVSRSLLGGFRSEIRMIGEKKYVSDDDR